MLRMVAIWAHCIAGRGGNLKRIGRIEIAARAALLTAFVLGLPGAVSTPRIESSWIAALGILLGLFGCGDPARAAVFQTAWFVESLLTELVIALVVLFGVLS